MVDTTHVNDSRMTNAIEELVNLISKAFPGTQFSVEPGEDPGQVFVFAAVDIEDPDAVVDLIIDRELELQIEERLPLHVIPIRNQERRAQLLAELAGTGETGELSLFATG